MNRLFGLPKCLSRHLLTYLTPNAKRMLCGAIDWDIGYDLLLGDKKLKIEAVAEAMQCSNKAAITSIAPTPDILFEAAATVGLCWLLDINMIYEYTLPIHHIYIAAARHNRTDVIDWLYYVKKAELTTMPIIQMALTSDELIDWLDMGSLLYRDIVNDLKVFNCSIDVINYVKSKPSYGTLHGSLFYR